jgi:hypothetical protein
MMNLLNFPYNLHEMMQDEEAALAAEFGTPHLNWTGKEQPNTVREQLLKNPPKSRNISSTEPKTQKISD